MHRRLDGGRRDQTEDVQGQHTHIERHLLVSFFLSLWSFLFCPLPTNFNRAAGTRLRTGTNQRGDGGLVSFVRCLWTVTTGDVCFDLPGPPLGEGVGRDLFFFSHRKRTSGDSEANRRREEEPDERKQEAKKVDAGGLEQAHLGRVEGEG